MNGRAHKRSSKSLNASQVNENHSPRKLRNAPALSSKGIESIVSESSPTVEKLQSPSPRRPTRARSIVASYSGKKVKQETRNRSAGASLSAQTHDQDDVEIVSVSERSPSVEKLHSPSCRRSTRARSVVSSYSENKLKRKTRERSASASSAQTSDQDDIASVDKIKPTTLFDEDADVEGDKLYSFKTPKKKDSMALLAQLTPKTPRHHDPNKGTPRTPINKQLLLDKQKTPTSRPSAIKLTKTPKHVRAAVKKSRFS